ncbi:aldehyde dehydrogenase family protein [Nocardia sp. NPDC005366]|uniref:aldehyde dehydrogenase family protein n=1 Tax=Nocardia sp. NPDC005366 TaxID=3156878 RepID=UPI0033BE3B2E
MTDQTMSMLARHEAAAKDFLPRAKLLINGEERESGSGGVFDHVNAATGRVQAQVPLAGTKEVDEAVAAARSALGPWRAMHPTQRRQIMTEFTRLVKEHPWTEMSVLENAQPWDQAAAMADFSAAWLEYYTGWADRLEGTVAADNDIDGFVYTVAEPYGVIGHIITWNSPLLSLGMKLAPSLAAGNTVVVKPAEFTSFTALEWIRLAQQAGIPKGVINLIPGGAEVGEAMVKHPGIDKISFTGGPPTAKAIMRDAAEDLTPLVFELGGKGANLIFADADLSATVPFACGLALANSGQGCALPTRMLVDRKIYDDVVAAIEQIMPALTVGDPLVSGHISGPLVNEAALNRVTGMIDDAERNKAGRLLVGGNRMGGEFKNGYFVENTVFVDVDPGSALAQTEVFGPVLSVIPFTTEEEAVEIANNTAYGLTNYIQTADRRRVRRLIPQLRSGTIAINGANPLHPAAPFGGNGISGFGREGGRQGIEEFLQVKTVLER